MKRLVAPLLTISVFVAVAFATDTQFKTRIITSATLTIHVRTGQYLTINNFTQQNIGSPSQRGVVIISVNAPTPTPAPTATPTPTPTSTPTPTATPTPTPSPTPTPTPTPTPITTIVLTAAISGASPAEFIKPVVIAGPAVATVEPVAGAILSITYRKQDQPIQPTPTPTATAATATSSTTPSPTSTPSGAEMIFEALPSNDGTTDLPTPTPIPTTPEPLATFTPTPTATPSFTPTPSPIPSPTP